MRGQTNLFVIVFLSVVLSFVGIVVIFNYNGLVKAEKSVQEAKAQIEAVCQRRLDLIPNVIEAVQGYVKHEQQTLLAITQARAQAMGILEEVGKKEDLTKEAIIKLESSQTELSKTLKNVFALVENYPDLKASMNFLALQDQMEGTENRISVARQRYNTAARSYNTKIETFPGIFLSPMFGFTEKDFYEAKPEALEPVKAEFYPSLH